MPKSALIVYISGDDSSAALKTRLVFKDYSVHCIAIDPADGRIRWHPDNGPAPQPQPLGSVVYDKVFIVGHHAMDLGMPTRRGVALGDRLLPTSHLIDILVAAGLHEPSRFVLIVCNAARGSSPGNVMENDIGYSTGHNFASRLIEIDWYAVEVHAYTQKIGVIDEGTHELMKFAASRRIIQPNQVLPVGSRYMMSGSDLPPPRPRAVAGSKMRFYCQNRVLCCSVIY
ncbi:hypothetical protein NWF24_07880 [Variovorax paradoxus]|uniref:hypothetical protein n=1 Tax=Variovorax paradoxus TaxID=34073 RepID=UPI0021ABA6F0|nr:hypothetical protein [Variovorax paradoxus]UVH59319.1 hypothetical protein NWF24_07880 [Variovorax paradoxus]